MNAIVYTKYGPPDFGFLLFLFPINGDPPLIIYS